jgi:hypothetical protein
MMVVGDTTEVFMPLLDGFLCDPEKSSHVIDALMEQIPTLFNETRTTETILLPAIKAGMEALKVIQLYSIKTINEKMTKLFWKNIFLTTI